MCKVIAIIRTSTDRQEVESQREEVISMVTADGHSMDDVEIVGQAGASAIKLDEAYLANMNKVYELIEEGGVTAVYAWAIDRIGRDEEVLMRFKNFLIDRKIQLVIKNPSLRLLNDDGSVNSGVEIAFSLFATMAKQEMLQKKARFKRAAKRNAKEGKYSGGGVLFGYQVSEDNHYDINEEEAYLIRLIFDLYNSSNFGVKVLRKELLSRGIAMKNEKLTDILSCEAYTGLPFTTRRRDRGNGMIGGYERIYPRIITPETFEKAKAKRASKHYAKAEGCFLAKGLIRCSECGWLYTGVRTPSVRQYKCGQRICASSDWDKHCDNDVTVQMEVTDSILWYASSFLYSLFLIDMRAQDTTKIEEQMNVLNQKIEACKTFIEGTSSKLEKIADMWIEGIYSTEKKDKAISKIMAEREAKERDIEAYETELHKLKTVMEKALSLDEYTLFANANIDVASIEDRRRMLEIVNQFVESVEVGKCEFMKRPAKTYKLNFKDGTSQRFLTIGKTRFTKFFEWVSDEWKDITNKVMLLQPV